MQQRILTIIILLSVYSLKLLAQPTPCEDPPMMTSFCADACIICDIDGFTGRHESTIVGQAPPGFAGECTFTAHNMQWIAFIAGSENLSVELSVSNCQSGLGLEFGLYKGIDCENFVRISNCFGGAAGIISPGESGVITNTESLVIGQYYFIVMDGGLGDNCDWTFSVLSGSTAVDPLTNSGVIQGDDTVCPELLHQYYVDPPIGATAFEWTVNNAIQDTNMPNLDYNFPDEGTYNICVTATNACDEAPPSCFLVEVAAIPVTEIIDVLCEGETYDIADMTLVTGGFYEFDLISTEGCDSLVTLELTEVTTPLLILDLNICEGDTLFIGDTPYTESGAYQEILTSVEQCDSIINLELETIVCNIISTDLVSPVLCNGEASGTIDFTIDNGTAPFAYAWEELNGTSDGMGMVNALGEMATIDDVAAGTYVITIADNFGNFDVIITEISEPEPLAFDFLPSDYNGVNVTCADGADGTLMAIPNGGTEPYAYAWNTLQQSQMIDQLAPGLYALTVSDAVGCTFEDAYELTAPEPLLLIGEFVNSDCTGAATGSATAVQTLGGVGAYQFSLNGGTFSTEQVFDGLPAGAYTLEVMDGNGCTSELTGELTAPQIPVVDLGEDYEISLGETIDLKGTVNNISVQQVTWESMEMLDCFDCLETNAIPFNSGFYTLSIVSEDNCTGTDSLFVSVNKFRKIFVPNAFSPNFDGTNDYFTVFGGPEVAMIKQLSVYNRWGALMFDAHNIEAGVETLGWDGTYKGKDMGPDVFGWTASIEFIDGEVLMYSGDITALK